MDVLQLLKVPKSLATASVLPIAEQVVEKHQCKVPTQIYYKNKPTEELQLSILQKTAKELNDQLIDLRKKCGQVDVAAAYAAHIQVTVPNRSDCTTITT
jgi:hypothetical protein